MKILQTPRLIVLKIEALFQIHCDGDIQKLARGHPPLQCKLCLQGSHDCDAIQNKLEAFQPILDQCPAGIVWLCHECLKKDNLDQLRPSKKKPENENEEVEKEDDDEEQEEVAEEEEERESPRRGREPQTSQPPRTAANEQHNRRQYL